MSLASWMRICGYPPRALREQGFIPHTALIMRSDGRCYLGARRAGSDWVTQHLHGFGFQHHMWFSTYGEDCKLRMSATRDLVDYLRENDMKMHAPWTAIWVHYSDVVFAFKSETDAIKARMFL